MSRNLYLSKTLWYEGRQSVPWYGTDLDTSLLALIDSISFRWSIFRWIIVCTYASSQRIIYLIQNIRDFLTNSYELLSNLPSPTKYNDSVFNIITLITSITCLPCASSRARYMHFSSELSNFTNKWGFQINRRWHTSCIPIRFNYHQHHTYISLLTYRFSRESERNFV